MASMVSWVIGAASAAAMAGAGAGAEDTTGAADLLSPKAEEELEESMEEAAAVEFCAGMVVGFWFWGGGGGRVKVFYYLRFPTPTRSPGFWGCRPCPG